MTGIATDPGGRGVPTARPARRFGLGPILGLLPFFLFAGLFLGLPISFLALGSIADNTTGAPTIDNYAALSTPLVVSAFRNSIEISLVTAIVGGIFGFLLAAAVILGRLPGVLRSALMTFSGVASNFAGIPLALAFIYTLSTQGMVTDLLNSIGIRLYDGDFNLFSKFGVEIVYLYFQFPLMVLIIAPAIDGLKREWREAAENMGAIELRLLAEDRPADPHPDDPRQHDPAVRQLLRRPGDGLSAVGRTGQSRAPRDRQPDQRRRPPQRRTRLLDGDGDGCRDGRLDPCLLLAPAAVGAVAAMMPPRPEMAPDQARPPSRTRPAATPSPWPPPASGGAGARRGHGSIFIIGALYFIVPLIATFEVSMRSKPLFSAYTNAFADDGFLASLIYSFVIGLITVVLSIALIVPTAYWVRLRAPRLRPFVEFVTLLPFVVPPVVLVFGLIKAFARPPLPLTNSDLGSSALLVFAYIVLSLPYMYRAVDSGLRAIDIRSLTEAAQSMGAGWPTILVRIILPNLRVALLSGAFLTLAIVIGEYTIASYLVRPAFGPYLQLLGANRAFEPAAVSLISFGLTWLAMIAIAVIGRGSRTRVQIGGAR